MINICNDDLTKCRRCASETERLFEHLQQSRVDVVFRADGGVAAACFVPRIIYW